MLGKIKQILRKNKDTLKAVDYLDNYIKYHLMNSYKVGKNAESFAMFSKNQLKFLVLSRICGLNSKQVNKIINIALRNVITSTKTNYISTKDAIYIAVL